MKYYIFLVLFFFVVIQVVTADRSKEKKIIEQKVHEKRYNIANTDEDSTTIDISHIHLTGSINGKPVICTNITSNETVSNGCSIFNKGYDITSQTYSMGVLGGVGNVCDCIKACINTVGCVSYSLRYTSRFMDQPRNCVLSMGITRVNTTGLYKPSVKCTRTPESTTLDPGCYSGVVIKWPDGTVHC